MSTKVITDKSVAVDHLLDARASCQDVRDSSLPGTSLYTAMEKILREIDGAIVGLRR